MNELITSKAQYLDSREVAEMVEKSHDKLLRDIRTYITQLSLSNIGESDFFIKSTYKNGRGKEYPCYLITKKGCEFIANKLTGQKGTAFTARYVNRFHEMEDVLAEQQPNNIIAKLDSYMIENPIERAKRWIEEYEEKLALEEKIKEDKPKVEYFDSIVEARLLTNFRDTAKELHLSQTQFTGWLLDKKFIYRDSRGTLLPYEPYRANGWFQVKDYVNRYNGFAGLRTLITPTGKAALKLILESEECSMSDFKKHGGRHRKSGS